MKPSCCFSFCCTHACTSDSIERIFIYNSYRHSNDIFKPACSIPIESNCFTTWLACTYNLIYVHSQASTYAETSFICLYDRCMTKYYCYYIMWSHILCFICLQHTATPFCGSVHLTPTGEIKTPGFNVFTPPRYLPNEDCIWRISTDVNRRIALGVVNDNFDIEEGSTPFMCNRDYLSVHDGDNGQARALGRFCGTAYSMRAFKTIYSSGQHLYIRFISNGQRQRKGFHLHYRTFTKGTVLFRWQS